MKCSRILSSGKQPGKLRRSQNWIGGARPGRAVFVPPPPDRVPALLDDPERFINEAEPVLPPLVRIALVHLQFETIDPFLDVNGRIGRLLIAALQEQWSLLPEPLVYLGSDLKQNQAEYYRRLSAVRTDGDWAGWVTFSLDGVETAASDAERSIVAIASLVAADCRRLLAAPRRRRCGSAPVRVAALNAALCYPTGAPEASDHPPHLNRCCQATGITPHRFKADWAPEEPLLQLRRVCRIAGHGPVP
ncbi:MAG: Fic family protein [Rubrivivax sp.]|nr:Fic family protein [Rubrivivax sp.]